jgi:hypothetical protein
LAATLPAESNVSPLSVCQPFSNKMIDPPLERMENVATEAAFRQRDPLARDELAVEPGSTNRRILSFDMEI